MAGESSMKRLLTPFLLILLVVAGTQPLHATVFQEAEKSAQQGDAAAQFKLAQMYEAGKKAGKDAKVRSR